MILALALCGALGATAPHPLLSKASAQIDDLNELGALQTLEKARPALERTPQMARLYLLCGLAHAGLSHEAEAVENFQRALSVDPHITLPAGSSPRVQEWWVRALPPPVAPSTPPMTTLAPLTSSPPLPARHSLARWIGAGALGVAAILSGVAIFNGANASAQVRQAQKAGDVVEAQALERQAGAQARAANVFYGLGAAFAVGGVVSFVFD